MKQELASLELSYLVGELQHLVGGKIDKIYQPSKEELLLQFYVQNKGKLLLRILSGKFIYLTTFKTESPQKPFGYCVYLRKYLNNARLLTIAQVGFERVVKLVLEAKKDGKTVVYHLYAELFGKGNVILCDQKDIILSPLETQTWKDRVVRAKEAYQLPKREIDVRFLSEEELKTVFQSSRQESIVKALALDLGLGGLYAEEACLRAGLDKNKKPAKPALNAAEIQQLFTTIAALLHHPSSPCVVKKGDEIIDMVPFPLQQYRTLSCESHNCYNEALDAILTGKAIAAKKTEASKVTAKAANKWQVIIDAEAEECQRAGELIYERYHLVEEILRELRQAREKHSWKEIRERLKGHKIIKEIDEKEGAITIEL